MSHRAFNAVVGRCVCGKALLWFWWEVSIDFLCQVNHHSRPVCVCWLLPILNFPSASTLSRNLFVGSFRRVKQDGQLILFHRFIPRIYFSSILVLSELFFASFLLPLPLLSPFLSPGWILVVNLLLLVPLNCHDNLFKLNTLGRTITIRKCMYLYISLSN